MNRELAILEKLEKELSLKQLQIKSLLTITQAINDNVSADGLFNMYKSFLSWEMGIEKMALFIIEAVSYTHLDVYKRQVGNRSPGPRVPAAIAPNTWSINWR